jgi:hypothetical protein
MRWCAAAAVVLSAVVTVQAAPADPGQDEFLRGYATAVVTMQFPSAAADLQVRDGVVYIEDTGLSEQEKNRLLAILSGAKGFVRLEFFTGASGSAAAKQEEKFPVFLAKNNLFKPLIADPRWPHFSAAYQRYIDDEQLRNVAAVSFGETFSLVRFRGPWDSLMEFGIKAGVFAFFDLDAESSDLINADYLVGLPLSFKQGNLSNITNVFHQSSHLGDEFLLRGRADKRVNLSYEAVSSIFSYQLPKDALNGVLDGFRLYGGGGYIFRKEPSDLDPWSAQSGLEFYSPWPLLDGAVLPVAGVDLQFRQESDWNTDISLRAGLQFQDPDFFSRKMQLLLEYYHGKSPNGQFYERDIESFGIGVHFFLD